MTRRPSAYVRFSTVENYGQLPTELGLIAGEIWALEITSVDARENRIVLVVEDIRILRSGHYVSGSC